MNGLQVSGKRLSWVGRVIAAAAVVLALAAPASAGPITTNPDLAAYDLTMTWSAVSGFSAEGIGVTLNWTDPLGGSGAGSPVLWGGKVTINWNGTTGLLSVNDPLPGLGDMLIGTVTGFTAPSGIPGGEFAGRALLTTSIIPGMGSDVHFYISANNWESDGPSGYAGYGNADITPAVPEPATLGLMSIGLCALAVRRRRARR
jgi:hypothetical protein